MVYLFVLVTLKVILLSAVWAGILKIQTSGIQAEINIIKAITTLVVGGCVQVFGVGWQCCGLSFLLSTILRKWVVWMHRLASRN